MSTSKVESYTSARIIDLSNNAHIARILEILVERNKQTTVKPCQVNDIVTDLTRELKNKIENFELKLFGSSASGLAIKSSDIDLCLVQALKNSQLLQTYGLIDERVISLCILVKLLSKYHHLCDSSKQSLSSYSYVLMIIHFLQRITLPILPYLQEIGKGDKKYEISWNNETYNVYFYDDLSNLVS
ncbi:unnamed protein product [Didymodactylos carnosus]|uniref:Poly(A) RNA polymerase mitochondrial-like central palm domain-containing protein n=1 Tax=Didymodactylos carnosus TaxID=1234261 RepID=A0A8S2ET73_9BILA|nr:unnamed protein product [Didymodactylos carnosus]CAF4106869.1 unnamed protein product [Didymodactylos carnosus]